MDEPPHVDYEFDGFRVDPVRRMLIGPDGQPVRLKPKVFDTLLYLVEHPHELLDKRTLLKAVWPVRGGRDGSRIAYVSKDKPREETVRSGPGRRPAGRDLQRSGAQLPELERLAVKAVLDAAFTKINNELRGR